MSRLDVILPRRLAIGVACVALAGCAVQPAYQRPAVPSPAGWSDRALAPGPATAWPETDWWRSFREPGLDALVAGVLAENHDLKAASHRIGQARATARIVGANRQPEITGGIGTRATHRFGGVERTSREHELGLSVLYEPDLWDRFANLSRAADANLVAAAEAERVVRLTLAADATTLFFRIAALDQRIDLARRTIAAAERIDGIIAARHDAGAVSALDREQSRTNLASIRTTLPPLAQAREETANALAVLAGRAPVDAKLVPPTLLEVALPERLPGGLPSELLQRRPDIRQAEALLAAAWANVGVARANLYPSLPLTAETGFASGTLRTLLQGSSGFATLGASLLAPVFRGDRLRAQVDLASEREQELAALYRQTILGAFRDVENALVALERLAELEAAQATAITHASRTLEIAEARYRSGFTDVIVLLTAQTTLLGAQDGLLQTRFLRIGAHVNLYRALGGGL
jgi:NodT family efflux transporter outer membrane factor (OMF) lipoprotein